jgi:hypothetical protein
MIHMERVRYLSLAALFFAASAWARPKLPVALFPGAEYSESESEAYKDERSADAAWVYRVHASFKKVSSFYSERVGKYAVAVTESKKVYIAITKHYEVRVEKVAKGLVDIKIARRDVEESKSAGSGSAQGAGGGTDQGTGGYGASGTMPPAPMNGGGRANDMGGAAPDPSAAPMSGGGGAMEMSGASPGGAGAQGIGSTAPANADGKGPGGMGGKGQGGMGGMGPGGGMGQGGMGPNGQAPPR